MLLKKKVRRKVKFRKKLKLWRLRESEVKEEFAEGVSSKCDGNEDWCGLKRKLLLDVASEVGGYTSGKPRHFKTRWWNRNVGVAVCRKIYLGFSNGVRMRKIGRNMRQNKMLRE